MKIINAYEYADLTKEVQEKVFAKTLNEEIEINIQHLHEQLNKGLITEEEYYSTLGCSKSYAESTSWFVPSCYYQQNEVHLEEAVKDIVESNLYTEDGRFIQAI